MHDCYRWSLISAIFSRVQLMAKVVLRMLNAGLKNSWRGRSIEPLATRENNLKSMLNVTALSNLLLLQGGNGNHVPHRPA